MRQHIGDADRLRWNQEHNCSTMGLHISHKLTDAILLGVTKFTLFSDNLMGTQTVIEEGLKASVQ